MGYASLGEMMFAVCARKAEQTGMMVKKDGAYREIKRSEITQVVKEIAGGLFSLGIHPGEKVCILSENRPEWAWSDYAILSLGAVTVPIYPTLLPKHIEYIINNCDSKLVLVSHEEQFAKLLEIADNLPQVKKFIIFDKGNAEHSELLTLDEIRDLGRQQLEKNPKALEDALKKVKRENLASIIYTSGTTGEPKGVMLTHENFLSNVEASLRALPIQEDKVFLSFLPLSHSFERMVGHFLAMHAGCVIAYAESIDAVPQNLQEVKPTHMASVPRLFEKIYARVVESMEAAPALRRKIFYWAVKIGKKANNYTLKNKKIPGFLKMRHNLAKKLVYSKLRERVGGRIDFFVSGGAPLSREIGEFFSAVGLPIIEGYGLTETSPVLTVNRLELIKFGSVGKALDNVELKIAEDGEIVARGPNIMKGYYKREADTREAIDPEGWFHTGDIGIIDEDGYLIITDRKKNLIVTAGGKNIAPQPIENALTSSRYIEQAVVIGDKRKFCSALIVPSMEPLEKFCTEKGIPTDDVQNMLANEEVQKLFRREIDAVSTDLAKYETIKKFILVERPFSIESGELTPTLKIKRRIVEKNFKEQIDALYD